MRNVIRASLVFLFAFAATAPAPAAAQDGDAAAFITDLGDAALKMLADDELTDEQRVAQFRHLLTSGFDLPLIGRYVLGRHWRRATKAERQEFNALFETFIVDSFAARLGQYGGETFEVTGARADGERNAIVGTEIILPDRPRVRVDWRLRLNDDGYKVIDVVVEGISMLITQRDEFASVIQRSGGRIEGLLATLRQHAR